MKIATIGFSLLLMSCAPLFQEQEALVPSTNKSDLTFVRTGDQNHYYIIDQTRGICLFHSRLYGKNHLTEIDCSKLPEYQPRPRPRKAEAPPVKLAPEPTPEEAPPAPSPKPAETAPPPAAKVVLTVEDKEKFRRAYVQHFCAQKEGREEALETILSRHQLNKDRYDQAKVEFSADRDLWAALSRDAMAACQ